MARRKLGALLQRKPVAPASVRPDFRDGREFDPVNPMDGRPRIVITESMQEVDGQLQFVIHVDHWNMPPENVQRLYLRAGAVIETISAAAPKGGGA